MRRILAQVAQAAARTKGSIFQGLYRRLLPRLGHGKAIWALAHRLCRLTWKILHQGVEYKELGQQMNPKLVRQRTNKLTRQLRALGYYVQLTALSPNAQA